MSLLNPQKKNIINDNSSKSEEKKGTPFEFKNDTIDQIKNITQEKKKKSETETIMKTDGKISINSFNQLIEICAQKKEVKLKYELEKNVNLVNFEKNRIEISFNDNLDKDFVKDLSLKLYEWTDFRWIITLSKIKGEISVKDKEQNKKNELLDKSKNTELYKNVLDRLTDAKLIDVENKINQED